MALPKIYSPALTNTMNWRYVSAMRKVYEIARYYRSMVAVRSADALPSAMASTMRGDTKASGARWRSTLFSLRAISSNELTRPSMRSASHLRRWQTQWLPLTKGYRSRRSSRMTGMDRVEVRRGRCSMLSGTSTRFSRLIAVRPGDRRDAEADRSCGRHVRLRPVDAPCRRPCRPWRRGLPSACSPPARLHPTKRRPASMYAAAPW
jgi:hypothetical protein